MLNISGYTVCKCGNYWARIGLQFDYTTVRHKTSYTHNTGEIKPHTVHIHKHFNSESEQFCQECTISNFVVKSARETLSQGV